MSTIVGSSPGAGLASQINCQEIQAATGQLHISAWRFVPPLYFLQAVPNIIVTLTFVSVYKDLGIDNLRITFWTSIISLPWTFKMFWAAFVDLNFTKRQWTIATQVLIFVALVLAAVVVRLPGFFELSLAALFMAAMLSATQDIACD